MNGQQRMPDNEQHGGEAPARGLQPEAPAGALAQLPAGALPPEGGPSVQLPDLALRLIELIRDEADSISDERIARRGGRQAARQAWGAGGAASLPGDRRRPDLQLAMLGNQNGEGLAFDGHDATDSSPPQGRTSYSDVIRKGADVLLKFFRSDLGRATGSVLWTQRGPILGVVQRYSDALGTSTMFFSLAFGLCLYDRHIHWLNVDRDKGVKLGVVDRQLEQLKMSMEKLGDLMELAADRMERIVTELVLHDSDQVDELFKSIETELQVAVTLTTVISNNLKHLEAPTRAYRRTMLLRNGIVAAAFAGVAWGLNYWQHVPQSAAAALALAGTLPLGYSYFWLGIGLETLLADIRLREFRNESLRAQLEIFRIRFDLVRHTRDTQRASQRRPSGEPGALDRA